MSFHFHHEPLLKEPPPILLPDPIRSAQWYGELWLQYPACQTLVSAHFGLLFKAKCEFRIIMNDLAQTLFGGSGPVQKRLTLEEASGFLNRFKEWENDLPPALSSSRLVLPAQLTLQ